MNTLTFLAAISARLDFLAAHMSRNTAATYPSKEEAVAAIIDYMRNEPESAWLLVYPGKITEQTLAEFTRALRAVQKAA